ncbi:MAG: cytochrome ubiquinol oxidase subunit I [Nitrososphaeria archaeon]
MIGSVTLTSDLITWAFDVHIPLVYTVLGLLWTMPFVELKGLKSGNPEYFKLTRSMFNYMVVIYAIGGVFGTIITVFLAGLMPVFTNLAGFMLWPVWAAAIVAGVMITIPMIGLYYRTFERWSHKRHIALGLIIAVSATIIPAMFRLVFAYTAYPYGTSVIPDPRSIIGFDLAVNVLTAFQNPLYLPLLFATVFAALAFTGIMMVFGYSVKSQSTYAPVGRSIGSRLVLVFGPLYAVAATWYMYEVYLFSPTIAWSLLGSPPPSLNPALYSVYRPVYILSWDPYAISVLAAVELVAVLYISKKSNRFMAWVSAAAGIAMVDLAEGGNLLAHLPYAVVPPQSLALQLIQEYGAAFALNVAKTLQVSTLATVLDYLSIVINQVPILLVISIFLFLFFNVLVLGVIYMALQWRNPSGINE